MPHPEDNPDTWGVVVYLDQPTRDALLESPSEQFEWEDTLPEVDESSGFVTTQERPNHQVRNKFLAVGGIALAAGVGAGYATVRIKNREAAA
jgi:hypothetical protein